MSKGDYREIVSTCLVCGDITICCNNLWLLGRTARKDEKQLKAKTILETKRINCKIMETGARIAS